MENSDTNNQTNQSSNSSTYVIHQQPKRSKKKVLFITCGVLLLIFACICSVFAIFSNFAGGDLGLDSLGGDSEVRITENVTRQFGDTTSLTASRIAIVDVTGAITYATQSDILPSGASNRTVVAQLKKAVKDDSVKVIVIRFNTPGGAVAAAEPICKEIKDTNTKKPVYAFIDTEGASLGYLLPNCTKYIYARPDSITGSIGVRADLLDLTGILTNLGARQTTITNTSGSQKTQDGLFDKNSAEYKQFQKILDETYEYFLNTVWAGRESKNTVLTKDKLRSYADGRIFSGKQAKEVGLVDEVTYYDEMLESVIEKENLQDQKVEVVEYVLEADPFANLFGGSAKSLFNLINGHPVQQSKVQLMMLSDF